jgi:hypothetical protein
MGSNELRVALAEGELVELACRGRSSAMAMFSTVFRRNSYLDLHAMTIEEGDAFAKLGQGKEPPVPRNLGPSST